MSISMYNASVPVFKKSLKALDAILDRAVAYADSKKIDHKTLLTARLFPDMFHFTKQVQIATDNAKGCPGRLAGVEIPKFEDNEASFAELKERIAKTIAFLDTLKPEQFEGSEGRDVVLVFGSNRREFKGLDYLLAHAIPTFFFHYTTAYDILRHNGLDLGKRDFMG